MRRDLALRQRCPKCKARAGKPCVGSSGPRVACHAERHGIQRAQERPARPWKGPKVNRTGFYWSDEWRQLRYHALLAHGGACQCCGARPTAGKPLHVDHIKPRSKFPELELDLSNLQVLCDDCNIGKGASDQTDWRDSSERASA